MAIHRPHPLQGEWNGVEYDDPEDAILFDDCDRCSEHRKMILSIDEGRLRQLWQEMLSVESGHGRDYYRTYNEAMVCHELHKMSIFMERILKIKPENTLNDQSLGATFSID